jgi:hypothetical protein
MSKKSIFIATPMYGGMATGFYTQSCLILQRELTANGIDSSFSFMFNESLITRARNALVDGFLKSECTHLFFIDADIKFNAADVLMMIKADIDILCGIYPKKEINWVEVKKAVDSGVPVDSLKNHTGSMVVNLVGYEGQVTVNALEPLEIWAGGTGFMMVKREVFEKLADKVPSYTNNVNDLSNGFKQNEIKEYFATSIDPDTNILLSEDYHFCHVARRNGIKVYAAPWVNLAHLGSYLFEGGLMPQEQQKDEELPSILQKQAN